MMSTKSSAPTIVDLDDSIARDHLDAQITELVNSITVVASKQNPL